LYWIPHYLYPLTFYLVLNT